MWTRVAAVVLGLVLVPGAPAPARESDGNAAAKARFAQGEAAVKAGKLADAVEAFRKAIDADPDYVDAHQRFIDVTHRLDSPNSRTSATPRLQQQYERWARQYPKRAVYQWALGVIAGDADAGDAHFQKALAIDPAFAPAHFQLAKNADLRGDFAAQRDHLKAACDLNPQESRYLLRYALAFQKTEPQRFRAMALDVVARFPASQQAAEALYHLAEQSPGPERRAYFDRLRAGYAFDRYGYSASAMYDLYAEVTTPEEALSVAQEMAKAFPAQKGWAQRVAIQDAMTRAKAFVAGGRFAEALDTLEKTQRPSGSHSLTWTLLKAEAAAGAGHADQAYAALLEMAATAPNERLDGPLATYGLAMGRTRADVDAEVWRARDAKAKMAPLFELPSSRDGSPVKLADYRGKLVLLTFWFPG